MRAQPPVHQWDGPPYNRTGYQSISTTSRLPQAQLDGGVQLPSIRNVCSHALVSEQRTHYKSSFRDIYHLSRTIGLPRITTHHLEGRLQ